MRRRPLRAQEPSSTPGATDDASLWSRVRRLFGRARAWLFDELEAQIRQHPYAAALAVYGVVRATGVTVQSGNQGLLFSFGRATRLLEPGFHLMIPFLQVARVQPSRSRTIDLQDQRVATLDGLVYQVHASLVWRIVDLRSALVEIDDMTRGMRDALAVSVWEVLKDLDRESLRRSEELDQALAARMEERLRAWGIVVERAGFQSIAPVGPTLRLVQLREQTVERERAARSLTSSGLAAGASIGLVGTSQMPARRAWRAMHREAASRHHRARRRMLHRRRRREQLS